MSFWRSESGRRVQSRLHAWGRRGQMAEAGGLGLCSGSGQGSHGSVGGLANDFLEAMDVDLSISEWGHGNRIARLLDFMYVRGMVENLVRVTFTLPDRSLVTLSAEEATSDPPVGYVDRRDEFAPSYSFNLNEFHDPAIDLMVDSLYPGREAEHYREVMTKRLHDDFAKFMAMVRGL